MPPEAPINLPPEGWFPDPDGGDDLRWWDGKQWTAHRHPRPPSLPPTEQPASRQSPNLTPSETLPAAEGAGHLKAQYVVGGLLLIAVIAIAVVRLSGNHPSSDSKSGSAAAVAGTSAAPSRGIADTTPGTAPVETLESAEAFLVEAAVKDIRHACQGFRKAGSAEEELEAYGNSKGATKRLIEGSIAAGTSSGLVEGDVRSLSRIFREKPNAYFHGDSLRNVLANTAAELRSGNCDPPDAARLDRMTE